jgi:hypothetical protein
VVAGVAAQQVMHAVPAVADLGQQSLPVQPVQQPGGFPHAGPGKRRGGPGVGGGARVQAQQAEQPLLGGIQVLVGHTERGGHAVVLGGQGEHAGTGLGA